MARAPGAEAKNRVSSKTASADSAQTDFRQSPVPSPPSPLHKPPEWEKYDQRSNREAHKADNLPDKPEIVHCSAPDVCEPGQKHPRTPPEKSQACLETEKN